MVKLEDIFGWLAFLLTLFIYISPAISFINVLKGKMSFEETPGVLVLATYISCFCWAIYGEIIISDQVKICNIIGAICSLCFIAIYLVYEIKKYLLDAILNTLIMITGSFATYRWLIIGVDNFDIIGIICIITTIIVCLYYIYLLYKILRQKNNYFLLPNYRAWISFSSYACWIIYGILIKDKYFLISNIFGIVFSIIQIIIYIRYKKKYKAITDKEKEEDKDTSTIDIEITGNDDIREDKPIKEDEDKLKEIPAKIISKLDN